jgi:hypothetical protein
VRGRGCGWGRQGGYYPSFPYLDDDVRMTLCFHAVASYKRVVRPWQVFPGPATMEAKVRESLSLLNCGCTHLPWLWCHVRTSGQAGNGAGGEGGLWLLTRSAVCLPLGSRLSQTQRVAVRPSPAPPPLLPHPPCAANRLEVSGVLDALPGLLEAKHVQTRTEAVNLYATVYDSVQRQYGAQGVAVLTDALGALRPAVRSVVAAAIAGVVQSASAGKGGAFTVRVRVRFMWVWVWVWSCAFLLGERLVGLGWGGGMIGMGWKAGTGGSGK